METLPVLFRVNKRGPFKGDVTAVFPTEPGTYNPATMSCYQHVGQHGSCHVSWFQSETRPATPDEYADLLSELKSIYETGPDAVRLRVMKRRAHWMTGARVASLVRIARNAV